MEMRQQAGLALMLPQRDRLIAETPADDTAEGRSAGRTLFEKLWDSHCIETTPTARGRG